MLDTLLESHAARSRRAGGMLVSVTAHTALIALAIVATARATAPSLAVKPPPIVYVAPPPVSHEAPHSTPPTGQHSTDGFAVPTLPNVATDVVPPHLPPIDLTRPATNDSVFGGTRRNFGPLSPDNGRLTSSGDDIYTAARVEKAVAPRSGNPAPLYPPALRAAQIEGSVLARFVVDTTGRAEPESITFLHTSHPQFAEAVRQSLLRSRYLPAIIGERPVRQLVEQRFEFTLTR